MNVETWMARADRALATAALVSADGDYDRAASTAYYAMFYAVRVALIYVGQAERAMAKSHVGMTSAFGQFLIQPGLVDARYGKALAFELNRRIVADYAEGGVSPTGAAASMASAHEFVGVVKALVGKDGLHQAIRVGRCVISRCRGMTKEQSAGYTLSDRPRKALKTEFGSALAGTTAARWACEGAFVNTPNPRRRSVFTGRMNANHSVRFLKFGR